MNIIFRKKVISQIRSAIDQYKNATYVAHPGLKGEIREIAMQGIFKPILPAGFNIQERVKIIDYVGNQSKEIDLVIYNEEVLPSIMFGEKKTLFPAESCLVAIEVKSMLTAKGVKETIKKSKHLIKTIKFVAGIYDDFNNPIDHSTAPIFVCRQRIWTTAMD